MTRREGRVERIPIDYPVAPPPSQCAKILYYAWKLCSVVFSHLVMISLVVAYCILGAVTFERLEAEHEREVKRNISAIRQNTTSNIWAMTRSAPLLDHTNWTTDVVHMLKDFESSILVEMKVRGWDGNESTEHIQWTFTGALFYSIIVITTIGYGHIAPKTQTGKVVTIFYAILGIPLMLLCLSNIGDVMASSFRFLYWRVCCYLCTRPPKRRRRHMSTRRSLRGRPGSTRRRKPLERAHSDTDFRYRDSGYSSGRNRRARLQHAPSGQSVRDKRTRSQPPAYVNDRDIEFEGYRNSYREPTRIPDIDVLHIDNEHSDNHDFPKISLPLQDLGAALKDLEDHHMKYKAELRSRSLPRPIRSSDRRLHDSPRNFENRRSLNEDRSIALEMHDLHDVDFENYRAKKALDEIDNRSTFRVSNDCDKFRDEGYDPEDDDFEFDEPNPQCSSTWNDRRRYRGQSEFFERSTGDQLPRRSRRAKSAMHEPRRWNDGPERDRASPERWHAGRERDKMWSEVDGGKKRRLRRLQTFDTDRQSPSPVPDDWSEEDVMFRRSRPPGQGYGPRHMEIVPVQPDPSPRDEIKPVPIWLCVFLVAFYIVVGTFLFTGWEGWPYLDAAYFCFITLTTIGFGDFVPAQGATSGEKDAAAAVHSIALCSLYLLFGIALLAMSFNLVQEEVRANVAAIATSLGIIKAPRDDPDDEDTDY